VEGGSLRLGGGNGSPAIVIPMRENPGAIVKAKLLFDEVLVTVSRPDLAAPAPGSRPGKQAAGDPGQRFAWTILTEDGGSFMFNGRGLVSEKIRHAKKLGHLRSALDHKQPGSQRARKIKRRLAREKARSARRVRDINHKITCGMVRACAQAQVTQLVLSQPDGIAQAPGRKAPCQRNGLWESGEQSRHIAYKAEGQFEVVRDEERGTSSTCPKCQHRSHPSGRVFRCPACG
jgi:putative transposase